MQTVQLPLIPVHIQPSQFGLRIAGIDKPIIIVARPLYLRVFSYLDFDAS